MHCITAQYHCVFDDWFSTADAPLDEVPDFTNEQWTYLFGKSHYQYIFDPLDGPTLELDDEFQDEYFDAIMRQQDDCHFPSSSSPTTLDPSPSQR